MPKVTEDAIVWVKDKIAPALKSLIVPLESLVPDPENARLHPDRNMDAIRMSLHEYGQVKPVVVRKSSRIVVAGNGTLAAAKSMGWTKIAASIVDMDEVQAAGYGLADNRTAELAKWDFQVVGRLARLQQDAGKGAIGFTKDEIDVLLAADWTPPQVEEGGEWGEHASPVKLTKPQRDVIDLAVNTMKHVMKARDKSASTAKMKEGELLALVCQEWVMNVSGEAPPDPEAEVIEEVEEVTEETEHAEDTGGRYEDTDPFPHWKEHGNGEAEF